MGHWINLIILRHFYVCDNYSLSKTALKNSPEAIERIAEMVKRIISEHKTKVLVTIHQDFKEKLKIYLENRIKEEVILKHFDGGRVVTNIKKQIPAYF